MHTRACLLTVLTALIVPAGAGAATLPARPVTGPAEGVTTTVAGKTLTVSFTGASAAWGRAHAGRKVEVECMTRPAGLLFAKPRTGGSPYGVGEGRIDAGGAAARVTLHGSGGDACQIDASATTWSVAPAADTAWAAATPAGVEWIDELVHGARLADVIYTARPHGTYAPAATVVAQGGGEVVALDDPNGTPPAGKIGYWSKGRAVSVIGATSTGKRLVVQDLGGGMLRTNDFSGFTGWAPVTGLKDDDASGAAPGDSADSAGSDDQDLLFAGEGDGGDDVHVRLSGDRVVFRFAGKAAKTYRRYAGQRVRVTCAQVPPPPLLGEALHMDPHPATTIVRVPRHGGVIRGDAPVGHRDMCAVEQLGGRDIVMGLVTAAGRRYMADMIAPLALVLDDSAPFALVDADATRYPGVATIVAGHPGLIPLATPGGPLKGDGIGVWTDADQRALIAAIGSDGHRYLMADEGQGMVRTNVYAGLLASVATLVQGTS